MSNNENHLFIFEGKRSEPNYFEKLQRHFLSERFAVQTVYGAEIYQLYEQLKSDEFALDIVNLMKERSKENADLLSGYTLDSFSYIYLFFDYDAHSTLADDEKLSELLAFFSNETENGMLYINYPMVEAVRHYIDMESFKKLSVKCKRANCPYMDCCDDVKSCMKEPHYKKISATDCRKHLTNINSYNYDVWQELITAHLYKMNYLVNDSYKFPCQIVSQETIFKKQLEKHIQHKCPMVAVLSAFPIFVLDYYGVNSLKERINKRFLI